MKDSGLAVEWNQWCIETFPKDASVNGIGIDTSAIQNYKKNSAMKKEFMSGINSKGLRSFVESVCVCVS